FNYRYVNDPNRITRPEAAGSDGLSALDWSAAIQRAREAVSGKKVAVLIGSDLTQEEAKLLTEFVPKQFPGATVGHFGTPGIRSAADDAAADRLLKRKSKTANLHGIEKLGIHGFDGNLPAGTQAVVIFRGGRAVLPELKGGLTVVGVGVFRRDE